MDSMSSMATMGASMATMEHLWRCIHAYHECSPMCILSLLLMALSLFFVGFFFLRDLRLDLQVRLPNEVIVQVLDVWLH